MLTFDEEVHAYAWDGRPVPSVSAILQGAGLVTGSAYYTPESANRGKRIHRATEHLDLFGELPEPEDEIRPYLDAYARFLDESQFSLDRIEDRVYGKLDTGEEWAGTYDRSGVLRGRLVILDIKTGAKAKWHPAQLAGYALADGRSAGTGNLYLKKTGGYTLEMVDAGDAMNARIAWIDAVRRYYADHPSAH